MHTLIKNSAAVFFCFAALAVAGGCSTTYEYGDAGAVPVYTTGFGPGELQQIADAMTGFSSPFPRSSRLPTNAGRCWWWRK